MNENKIIKIIEKVKKSEHYQKRQNKNLYAYFTTNKIYKKKENLLPNYNMNCEIIKYLLGKFPHKYNINDNTCGKLIFAKIILNDEKLEVKKDFFKYCVEKGLNINYFRKGRPNIHLFLYAINHMNTNFIEAVLENKFNELSTEIKKDSFEILVRRSIICRNYYYDDDYKKIIDLFMKYGFLPYYISYKYHKKCHFIDKLCAKEYYNKYIFSLL